MKRVDVGGPWSLAKIQNRVSKLSAATEQTKRSMRAVKLRCLTYVPTIDVRNVRIPFRIVIVLLDIALHSLHNTRNSRITYRYRTWSQRHLLLDKLDFVTSLTTLSNAHCVTFGDLLVHNLVLRMTKSSRWIATQPHALHS